MEERWERGGRSRRRRWGRGRGIKGGADVTEERNGREDPMNRNGPACLYNAIFRGVIAQVQHKAGLGERFENSYPEEWTELV